MPKNGRELFSWPAGRSCLSAKGRVELSRSGLHNDRARSKAAAVRQPDTRHLNVIADCYHRLGDAQKAREALKRSLEIDPEQVEVRQKLETLAKSQSLP